MTISPGAARSTAFRSSPGAPASFVTRVVYSQIFSLITAVVSNCPEQPVCGISSSVLLSLRPGMVW